MSRDEHDRRQNERRNQGRGLQRSCWICLAAPGVGCTTDNGLRVTVAGVPFVHDLRWHGGPILVPAVPDEHDAQDEAWRRW